MHDYFKWIGLTDLDKQLMNETDFYSAPASTKYHGDYEGGLASHSMAVASLLDSWTERLGLVWRDKRSPIFIGLLHDICKIDMYKPVYGETGKIACYEYRPEADGFLHGVRSVDLLKNRFNIELTDEEEVCIMYHMGPWTKDVPDTEPTYSQMLDKYHNLLWVHTADMYASQILFK